MISVKELFRDKQFSEETLQYLEVFINEFEELFGKYVPREELIEMIKRNVNKIEFKEELDCKSQDAMGCYNLKEKKIQISSRLKGERIEATLFHEMLHAIAYDRKGTGFLRIYMVDKMPNINPAIIGMGWNEGFVELLTKERNRRFIKNYNEKPGTLEQLVKLFGDLFGQEELRDIYFNRPNELIEYLGKRGADYSTFLTDFDEIYDERNSIDRARFSMTVGGGKDTSMSKNLYSEELLEALERVIQVYLNAVLKERIENPEQLNIIFKNIIQLHDALALPVDMTTIQKALQTINPEIIKNLDGLDPEVRGTIKIGLLYDEFKKLKLNDKIAMLANGKSIYSELEEYELNTSLSDELLSKLVSELYQGDEMIDTSELTEEWIKDFSYVAQYVIDNDLSFENLRIEYNVYCTVDEYEEVRVLDIYNLQADGKYKKITTLAIYDEESIRDEDDVCVEFKPVSEEERTSIRFEMETDFSDAAKDDRGNFLIYDSEGQSLLTDSREVINEPTFTTNFGSINESKLRQLDQTIEELWHKLELALSNDPEKAKQIEAQIYDAKQKKEALRRNISQVSTNMKRNTGSESKDVVGDETAQSLGSVARRFNGFKQNETDHSLEDDIGPDTNDDSE